MNKQLGEMSNEELGQLFPIIISEPDPNWKNLYKIAESEIRKALGKENIARIRHIGSTSVPHMKSKPTIDILLEVPSSIDKTMIIEKFDRMDYHYIPQPENPAPHMMFTRGYTTDGFKGQAYHVHIRYSGDWDELHFRDYLLAHPDVAREYGELKVQLSKMYKNDREGYTAGKTDFIKRVLAIARKEL